MTSNQVTNWGKEGVHGAMFNASFGVIFRECSRGTSQARDVPRGTSEVIHLSFYQYVVMASKK